MIFKNGVDPKGIRNEMMCLLMIADTLWRRRGSELVITSITDSKHSLKSLHYSGQAADLRVWDFKVPESEYSPDQIAKALWKRAGSNRDYDIIVHYNADKTASHIHAEWQPKR